MSTKENSTIAYYRENASSLAQRYESAQVDDLHALMLKWLPKKKRPNHYPKVLELGCGSGREAAFLAARGYDIIGIDASPGLLKEAEKAHPELENCLFCRTLPHELKFEETFDAVISVAMFMHLTQEHAEETLKKAGALLNKKGILIFSVCIERLDLENGFDAQGRQFTLLPAEIWKEMCENAGLEILFTRIDSDGLNRSDVKWLNCICQKK